MHTEPEHHDPAMPGPPAETPSEERRVDGDKRDRITEIVTWLRGVVRKMLIGQVLVALACFGALALGAINFREQRGQNQGTRDVANFAAGLARQINADRRNNIVRSCRESNDSNRATTAKLDALLAQRATRPDITDEERRQLKESRDGTVALINALRPYRPNCVGVADQQVSPAPQPRRGGRDSAQTDR